MKIANSNSPLYWICNGQASSNLVSQGASMNTHGIPNDMSMSDC